MKLLLLIFVLSAASLITSAVRFSPTRLIVTPKSQVQAAIVAEVVDIEVEVDTSTKYFSEPGNDQNTAHYDARYYTGSPVSDSERAVTLHHMIRAYISTFRDLKLETWIAHGTLLGWWWNGQILPWDWDIDVQVSAATLAHLAAKYNSTIHSYGVDDGIVSQGQGVRRYFLDVNPWQFERVRGDGMNIIDARWIDMSNGLFIDITGISVAEPGTKPGVWSCKNGHDYLEEDIWPVRETIFEGVLAKVPHAFTKVLVEEYSRNALTSTTYDSYKWDSRANAWIFHEPLPEPTSDPDLKPVIGEPAITTNPQAAEQAREFEETLIVDETDQTAPSNQQSFNQAGDAEIMNLSEEVGEEDADDDDDETEWLNTILGLA